MTADLAVIAMAAVALASIGRDLRVQMKVADRLRLVNPPRQPEAPRQDAAAEPAKNGPVPLERAS